VAATKAELWKIFYCSVLLKYFHSTCYMSKWAL